eukprot:gnl/TRDRNA2_/TRDRNA2_127858_c0_seq2.p1 gnl/TRDRNA2_/TRDRNA2_127858_c0~~gnl/TRDRNA2_/TRDRNA2_127858_c0_seq2.p1  ORF type:complete len:456 (-),score=98.02 gnl/TRDRNA2_/TRDRNA2_127858_c0_seq2:56-1219(-)
MPHVLPSVALDEIWHPLPPARSIWELAPDGELMRVEVPSSDTRWTTVVGDSTKPRVKGRVSVVVPTTGDRYQFHAQVFLCFHAQTHTNKELIVVDSGEFPSPFFVDKRGENFKYVWLEEPLSAGEKRNIGIRDYSTGEIIANFDDDDLYFPAYLQTMVKALQSSKAAMVHLSAWNTLDIEMGFCGIFDSSSKVPSEEEATRHRELCGFSMVYTHAAWRSVPWPPGSVAEDRVWLRALTATGLPVTSRAEASRLLTVLHLQHGRNTSRSVCHSVRKDAGAISAMIDRFDVACRRILGINMQEYDQLSLDGGLLYCPLKNLHIAAEPPSSAEKGLHVLRAGEEGEAKYRAWQASAAGMRPDRDADLRRQSDRLRRLASEASKVTEEATE